VCSLAYIGGGASVFLINNRQSTNLRLLATVGRHASLSTVDNANY